MANEARGEHGSPPLGRFGRGERPVSRREHRLSPYCPGYGASELTGDVPNGGNHMTKKADFNAEEWSAVVEGPLLAGMRVITAGRGGTLRESLAMGQTYAKARQQQGDSELLDELVSAPPAMDPNRVRPAGDIASATTERLRQAVQILQQKATPTEVEEYKHFVMTLAREAANANREGGFLGMGGQQVSEGEQAALDEIAATLDGTRA